MDMHHHPLEEVNFLVGVLGSEVDLGIINYGKIESTF